MIEEQIFESFPKIKRLSREVVITEKIDGTNAQVYIYYDRDGDLQIQAGSCNRWLTLENDNFGFARYVEENKEELLKLGPGRHYGEWWGLGIQRGYGLSEKRFSLFNTSRWNYETKPQCCHVVPELGRYRFDLVDYEEVMEGLKANGSYASPGFKNPEGIVVFHTHSNTLFKKTFDKDETGKDQ